MKEAFFASRIYPIERFTEEPATAFVHRYRSLLGKYLDCSALTGILEGSSDYSRMNGLMHRAVDLAHAETDVSEKWVNGGRNLASVFSRLSVDAEQKKRSEFYRYSLAELSPQNGFPVRKAGKEGKEKLVSGFYVAMDKLSAHPPKDYHGLITGFDRISLQFMWCIAASDYEGEDISLYDYMKISEAIMVCLLKAENMDTSFALVSGAFSGIQKYIFGIASANQSGVAKRLRARSFYVDIVSRVFSQYVADCFDVDRANILLQTGGKFYCLVPMMHDMDRKMIAIREEFDTHLYHTFHGLVSVNLAWISCTDQDIQNYSDSIVRLNDRLGEMKNNPFSGLLKKGNRWDSKAFVLSEDLKDKHICKGCGSVLIDVSKEVCPMCSTQTEIGGKLPRTNYIIYTKNSGDDTYHIFGDYYIRLAGKADPTVYQDSFLIEALNRAKIPDADIGLPFVRKYMANHIPVDGYETKTFTQIADQGKGMAKLAVLKADVDILGFLFAQGLRTRERHFGTISRVNTMSRMLELFFSGYVEDLLERRSEYRDVYSVFSGGDDLFLIGPWDVMMTLAVEIRNEFRRFSAQNTCVTMSAAVHLFGSREHVANMAMQSEEQLNRAKNELLPAVYPERTGRNAVCVMEQVFSWEDFEKQLTIADRLTGMVNDRKIGINILRRIGEYSDMYKQFLVDRNIWKLMFEPLFYYDRKRNYIFRGDDKDCDWFQYEYVTTMDNAADYRKVKKNLFFADTTVKIALYKTRKERS